MAHVTNLHLDIEPASGGGIWRRRPARAQSQVGLKTCVKEELISSLSQKQSKTAHFNVDFKSFQLFNKLCILASLIDSSLFQKGFRHLRMLHGSGSPAASAMGVGGRKEWLRTCHGG